MFMPELDGTMKAKVIDGDTFDADLNRNGKFSNPEERIRLLYIDTPELSKSHKGKDPKFGLPAKGYLSSVLRKTKAVLWVDPSNRTGNYGRLLAVLEVKSHNINLALIKQGHSYFDTRYSWPDDFKTYEKAEAYAFEKHLALKISVSGLGLIKSAKMIICKLKVMRLYTNRSSGKSGCIGLYF